MNCPICGGEMWDNRGKKRNPKAPDFKCKDKACEGVIWPPKGRLSHDPEPMSKTHPKWTWFKLGQTYERCLLLAEMRIHESGMRGPKSVYTGSDVVAAAATLFIEACRSGVEEPKAKLPPKVERQETEPEEEEAPF